MLHISSIYRSSLAWDQPAGLLVHTPARLHPSLLCYNAAPVRFFVGLHHPNHAKHFDSAFISVNRLRGRKSSFPANDWIMDSGAFSTISRHGGYPHPVSEYAHWIRQFVKAGQLLAAVAQDYMCEPHMLARTGMTVAQHQQLTIERYNQLAGMDCSGVYVMPVLQGYSTFQYLQHLDGYDGRLAAGAWVGVGSVCKRNGNPSAVLRILAAIKRHRPDLRLHGFGLKATALGMPAVRRLLESADSMAWSFAARREGRGPDANKWEEAADFVVRMNRLCNE